MKRIMRCDTAAQFIGSRTVAKSSTSMITRLGGGYGDVCVDDNTMMVIMMTMIKISTMMTVMMMVGGDHVFLSRHLTQPAKSVSLPNVSHIGKCT